MCRTQNILIPVSWRNGSALASGTRLPKAAGSSPADIVFAPMLDNNYYSVSRSEER